MVSSTLNTNSLSGTIPSVIGSLTALQYVTAVLLRNLENCDCCTFPYTAVSLDGAVERIRVFDLSLNQLSGVLPQSLSSLNGLQYVSLLQLVGNGLRACCCRAPCPFSLVANVVHSVPMAGT